MALRRTLTKRLFPNNHTDSSRLVSPPPPLQRSLLPRPNASKGNLHRELLTSSSESSSPADVGFFRRFLQQRGINQSSARFPEFLMFPVGDRLREKLKISGDRLRLEGLTPPVQSPATASSPATADHLDTISVQDARKILRSSQLEKLRSTLRQITMNSIPYDQFIQICSDVCSNREQGFEFAKMLDEAGNVIVLGNVVFLRPDQVAKSMEKLIAQSIAIPNDPRKQELEKLEEQKTHIDVKAESLVRGELYCGLGFLALQTLGFMRLTFWEFSWDVMEPICFFVTSFHFGLAYVFFLRTSKEPTFEGFFQRRFRVKQKKLMKTHNFDMEKYNELCEAFYPNYNPNNPASVSDFRAFDCVQAGNKKVFG